jgi:hypothetical protein
MGEVKHGTGIEWTYGLGYKGETWNPVTGCSKVSAGCRSCYAEELSLKRMSGNGLRRCRVADLMRSPWFYRWRFSNWLIARPWRVYPFVADGWRYGPLYGTLRAFGDWSDPGPRLRVWAAWRALTFPHVHHESEDWGEEFRAAGADRGDRPDYSTPRLTLTSAREALEYLTRGEDPPYDESWIERRDVSEWERIE